MQRATYPLFPSRHGNVRPPSSIPATRKTAVICRFDASPVCNGLFFSAIVMIVSKAHSTRNPITPNARFASCHFEDWNCADLPGRFMAVTSRDSKLLCSTRSDASSRKSFMPSGYSANNQRFMIGPSYRSYCNNLSTNFTNARYFFYPKPYFANMLDHVAA